MVMYRMVHRNRPQMTSHRDHRENDGGILKNRHQIQNQKRAKIQNQALVAMEAVEDENRKSKMMIRSQTMPKFQQTDQ